MSEEDGPVAELLNLLAPSLREVAERLGVSYDTVRAWKLGRRTPSRENLIKLAAIAKQHSAALSDLAQQIQDLGKE